MGAPSAGSLATQASTGQCAGLGQQAVSNNTRGRGTEASTTRQVPSTTGTIAPRPVASQAVQPAYVGEAAVSGNTRGKSTTIDAGSFQGTFVNPTLYSAFGRDGGPTRQPLTSLCMQGVLQPFARRLSISRRLNRPILISLSCLCHLVLSVMASSTRPCRLTPVKRYLTAFYTAMVTLNGSIRASRSTATGSPPFNLFP